MHAWHIDAQLEEQEQEVGVFFLFLSFCARSDERGVGRGGTTRQTDRQTDKLTERKKDKGADRQHREGSTDKVGMAEKNSGSIGQNVDWGKEEFRCVTSVIGWPSVKQDGASQTLALIERLFYINPVKLLGNDFEKPGKKKKTGSNSLSLF
jgi:hypothetical protein